MDIQEWKNKYGGKRVFLVGNGPSLNDTNLDLIENELSFGMNRISLIYEQTKWRPTFFICTTTNVRRPTWHADIMDTVNTGIPTFAWSLLKQDIGDVSSVHFMSCSHGNKVVKEGKEVPADYWSDDISNRVCKFGTSMLPAYQIAAYMGFKKIYLLGCDLGFRLKSRKSDKDPNHFDPKYGTPGATPSQLNSIMVAAHKLAKKMCDERGIEVYNCTVGGNLELFPRVKLEDIC
jgi:hypothetical protein